MNSIVRVHAAVRKWEKSTLYEYYLLLFIYCHELLIWENSYLSAQKS